MVTANAAFSTADRVQHGETGLDDLDCQLAAVVYPLVWFTIHDRESGV
jgi:hypothetical protein